ncbi:MAG: helix-turn-helix domain-containing protein [Methylotenera sp.]|nr:helix-turn-helix domain-containing protein [Methylotenera sp.]
MLNTYSFTEAVAKLKTSESTLSVLLNNAKIAAAKIGQGWVIREEDLDSYLKSEVERQTLERLAQLNAGIKPKVASANPVKPTQAEKRSRKPDLDNL